MGCRNLFLSALMLATCAGALAQSSAYGLGRIPTAEEIRAWDITISNDGKGLPAGSGTAVEGAKIYAQKCAICHGPNGRGGLAPAVVISKDLAATPRERRVMVTRVPFSSVLWDYINRAMPLLTGPGTLKPNEVYALTAFLLYENDVINESEILDAQTLPKVKMPNRDAYVPPVIAMWKPDIQEPSGTRRAKEKK